MTGTAMTMGFTKELMAARASAGMARALVARHLEKWNVSHVKDQALTIMGELFNNAIRVTEGPSNVRIHASVHPTGLWVAVMDTSPGEPMKRKPVRDMEDLDSWGEEDFGGWGLHIVESLSTHVWTERPPGGGKWVCAEISLSEG